MMVRRWVLMVVLAGVALMGCGGQAGPGPVAGVPQGTLAAASQAAPNTAVVSTATPVVEASATLTPVATQVAEAPLAAVTDTPPGVTSTPPAAVTETATSGASQTAEAPTLPASPTAAATYIKLRGEVIPDQANCRYGPGAPYLYKYGVIKGSNLEIIGRNAPGTWIEVRAIGGTNPCWLKADLMKVKGDVMNVAPIRPEDVRLPASPYYGPLTGVSASRSGNDVMISWNALVLRAGDDSEQYRYLVETWVCQAGQLVFIPLGTYDLSVKIADEPGCTETSHARVFGVEKHGYTRWIEVTWPAAR
jgi:hypothetical protein